MNHAGIETGVGPQKWPQRFRRNITATRERYVRMERAQIGLEAGGECGFLHALVQLKKMRMPPAHAEPENIRPAFAGKCAEADKRKEKRLPGDGGKICAKLFLRLGGNVPEKTEREMHLLRREPAHTAQVRIEFREKLRDRVRKLDADEEPFRAHLLNSGRARLSRAGTVSAIC